MSIFTRAFWAATGERAIKTFAQTAASVLVVAGVSGVLDADWKGVVSAAGLAAVISLLTSVAGNVATGTGPSFIDSEQIVPAVSPEVAFDQAESNASALGLGDPRDLDGDGRDDSTGRFVPKT